MVLLEPKFAYNYALSPIKKVIRKCLNSGGYWLSHAVVAFNGSNRRAVELRDVLIRT